MDNPNQISEIINIITGSKGNLSKESNKSCEDKIKKYYRSDVEYKHFFVYIPSSNNSREKLIALYKVHRGFTWQDRDLVHDVWFNEDSRKAIIDVTQTAKRGLWFWFNHSIRLLIRLDFSYDTDGKYVIRKQEVFVHQEEIAGAFVPFLAPKLILLYKWFLTWIIVLVGMFYGLIDRT